MRSFTYRCQHVYPPLSHIHVLLYLLYWLIDYSLTFLLLVSSSSPPLSTSSFFPSHFLPCAHSSWPHLFSLSPLHLVLSSLGCITFHNHEAFSSFSYSQSHRGTCPPGFCVPSLLFSPWTWCIDYVTVKPSFNKNNAKLRSPNLRIYILRELAGTTVLSELLDLCLTQSPSGPLMILVETFNICLWLTGAYMQIGESVTQTCWL